MTKWIEVTDTERDQKTLVNVSLIREIRPLSNGECAIHLSSGSSQEAEDYLIVAESYEQVRDSILCLDGMVRTVKGTVPSRV